MGMLIKGKWREQESVITGGRYLRQKSVFDMDISDEVIAAIAEQPGRFVLIGSWTCPWSHRTLLFREIKGLQTYIPLHMTGGTRIEGYPANSGLPWHVPGTDSIITHLHQLYTLDTTDYTGRSTIPILWDSENKTIISNESSKIIRAFDKVEAKLSAQESTFNFTLVPDALSADIQQLNTAIYHELGNGVYKANFATSQEAYTESVEKVFSMLERLDERLAGSRFLFGETLTESDVLLFPTLVRFDLDYFIHSRCSRKRLTEYQHLWAYARDLFSLFNGEQTINFDAIHKSNYNGANILPVPLYADWHQRHFREKLGDIKVTLRNGQEMNYSKIKG